MLDIRLRKNISNKKLSVARNDLIYVPKIIRENNDERTTKSNKKSRYLC